MNKRDKIIYWVVTGLLSVMLLMSAGMYLFTHDEVSPVFNGLGFPTWVIYPLAIAKILGLVAIWTRKSALLKEWAYAGYFFNFLLALAAHLSISDGDWMGAAIALALLVTSYIYDGKAFAK